MLETGKELARRIKLFPGRVAHLGCLRRQYYIHGEYIAIPESFSAAGQHPDRHRKDSMPWKASAVQSKCCIHVSIANSEVV
jgi:hypothetical protein